LKVVYFHPIFYILQGKNGLGYVYQANPERFAAAVEKISHSRIDYEPSGLIKAILAAGDNVTLTISK
tara:strand:- start:242 stop:442 length:201 start_codon:yes stop_codon:yes gene_type:complete